MRQYIYYYYASINVSKVQRKSKLTQSTLGYAKRERKHTPGSNSDALCLSLTRDRARAIKEGFAGAGRARPKKGRRGRQRAPQLPGKEGGGKPAQRGDLHLRSAARLSIASLRREPAFPLHLRAARRLRKNKRARTHAKQSNDTDSLSVQTSWCSTAPVWSRMITSAPR